MKKVGEKERGGKEVGEKRERRGEKGREEIGGSKEERNGEKEVGKMGREEKWEEGEESC